MAHDAFFQTGGLEIELDYRETAALREVLSQMATYVADLEISMRDQRQQVPASDEEAGVLLGALEILVQRGTATPAMRRLHHAVRQRRSSD